MKSLHVIMFVYCVLTTLYAVLTPPWETPDEPAHYRYVVQLADRWRPPSDPLVRQTDRFCRDRAYVVSNYEWYHPFLGYLPGAIAYSIVSLAAPESLPGRVPPFNPSFCSDPFTHPSLFELEATSPLDIWHDNWGLLILRILSSLWGLIVIYAVHRTGKYLGMKGFETVAAAWVAFLPQFVFISASVRNDTAGNAIAALLFLLSTQMQVRPQRCKRTTLTMGLLLAAGMLTKLTLAYLIPVVLLVVMVPPVGSPCSRSWLRSAVRVLSPTLIAVSLYYLGFQEARMALSHTRMQMGVRSEALTLSYWRPFLPMLTDLFFARFGWANVIVPSCWIKVASGVWIAGSVLSLLQILRLSVEKQKPNTTRTVLLLALGLFFSLLGVIRYNLSQFQPQGRFLFPALVPWALVGTWGLAEILTKHPKLRSLVGLALIGFWLLFNLRSLIELFITYY